MDYIIYYFVKKEYHTMKKQIKTTEAIFPMPVLLISTFNEDGTVDVMNAAWGTMLERDQVALNLTETHKTVQNIKVRKGFVVHIADAKHIVEADYFGIVSGNKEPDKFAKSGMTFTKSDLVDAPVINEFPIALECEFIEYQNDATGIGVIGKVLRTSVEEDLLKDGKVDIDSLEAIAFDPYTHGYYKVGGRVGEAFKDGLKIK
jgi:flavin reductase (DIM6/NTAB) family NADH-FMN oxidoreductase RutF